jgi:hypothetical protein
MATIVTRAGKGSPLTNNEVDANFTNLNIEVSAALSAAGIYLASVAGANNITASTSVPLAGYVAGQAFRFVAAGTNTAAVTLNINGLGVRAVTKDGAVALALGDIAAGAVIEVVYDGTQFQIPSSMIGSGTVADGSIVTAKLADSAVTTVKLASGAVTAAKLDPALVLPIVNGGTGAMTLAAAGLAQLGVAQTFTATQVADNGTASVSTTSTYTFDGADQIRTVTFTNAITVTFGAPTGITPNAYYTFRLLAGDTSARTFAWNSAYKFPAATPPLTTGTATNGASDIITFIGGATNTLLYVGHQSDVR